MQMKNVEHKWTVQDIPSQEGRLAVVTGATSGVCFYTAKELARKRATVIMPARDMRKAKEAAERIEAEVPKARLYLANLDLAEFDSVREFGEHLRQRYGTGSLDLLVNNAGIATVGRCLWDESERVTEMQFVVSAPSIGIHDRPCVVG
jgi:NAD(P)-dependent dehydrogenase (short-subunit alcohol dehydrogenase family)